MRFRQVDEVLNKFKCGISDNLLGIEEPGPGVCRGDDFLRLLINQDCADIDLLRR